jgi:two-component system OmpR family sensor kinase
MRSFAMRLQTAYALVGFVVLCLVVLCFTVLALVRAGGVLESETHAVVSHVEPLMPLFETQGVRRLAPALVAKVQSPWVVVMVIDVRTGAIFLRGKWYEQPPRHMADEQPPSLRFAGLLGVRPERLLSPHGAVLVVPSAERLTPSIRAIVAIDALLIIGGGALCILLARSLASAALRPLDAVTIELEHFGAGVLRPERVGATPRFDEFVRLAKAYEAATQRVSAAFARREQSEREMRRFVGDAAHELRTPLTIIDGCIHALTNENDTVARAGTMETLAAEQRRLRSIVDHMLLLMRLEAPERSEADAGAVDVVQCVEERVTVFARAWPDRRITCAVEPGLNGVAVLCSEDELRIALDNLIENALKHAPGSAVEVLVERAGQDVIVAVRDSGPGLDDKDREHAFDRFYRGSETRGAVQGSGLGLAIVRRVAERHGGSVSLSSSIGAGCRVALRIPAAPWATSA